MKKAFTLIELLVVISIISLLASIVLASLNNAREKGRLGSAKYFSAQVDHTVADQAVGVWDFDECTGTGIAANGALDVSGSGNNATQVGSPLWSSDAPFGRGCSMSFNGSNQYLQISPGIALTSKFTMSAWFKTANGQQSGWRTIFSKQLASSSNNRNYWLGLAGSNAATYCDYGSLVILYSVGGVADVGHACSPRRMDDNQWHFGTVTYDGTTLKLYVDGSFQGGVVAANPDQQTFQTTIGMYSDLSSLAFNGLIDGARLFSRDLTAFEIEKLYASGLQSHQLVKE